MRDGGQNALYHATMQENADERTGMEMETGIARQKILIADDSEINRSILADMLDQDFDVLEAEDGRGAMEILHRLGTGLAAVLLDLVMPVMDGVQVLKVMRAEGLTDEIPVVVLMAEGMDTQVDLAYDLGAVDSIRRPFDMRVVRRRVHNVVTLYAKCSHRMDCAHCQDRRCMDRQKDDQAASERTLRLLEHERTKYRFFASMSREVQFEYTLATDTLTLPEWGARHLGVDEILVNPREHPTLCRLLGENTLRTLSERLRETTPEQPVVEYPCTVDLWGERRWGKIISRALWSGDEPPVYQGSIGKIVDTHEAQSRIEALEKLAAQDSLTGLLNRDAARQRIEGMLKDPSRTYVLAVVDLDHFKEANDRYGHLFGDKVLKHMASRLRGSIRSTDLAARVGGDEFLLFVEYGDKIEKQIDRIFRALSGEFEGFPLTVSMGAARSPWGDGSYDNLFRRADQALYAAKGKGRNCYCFYDESMKTPLSVLSPIESDSE